MKRHLMRDLKTALIPRPFVAKSYQPGWFCRTYWYLRPICSGIRP